MPDDPRIQQLLDELIESHGSPETVCSSCPELLSQVRERWRQMCRARDELDDLFPPMTEGETGPQASPPGDILLPVIPGYEVDAVLGVGGMGVVFRARHLRLNRVVALKMALTGAYAGRHERERFQREAEAIASLRHPNVVQIHDVGDSEGRPYFTMEFLEGGSLAQKLGGLPQPARESALLLESLAVAVHAAHANGIIHRDLKPGNVLLTADGTPKVGDFGLARRLGGEAGLTRTGAALGTPSYMAPEQTKGHGDNVGPGADIYSLGAILYELLTGRPPFLAESSAETLAQLLSRDPVPPSRLNGSVPRDLETICLKCLQKEPRHRYATAAALASDFGCFLRGEGIAARPDGPLKRLIRRVRRRPVVSGAVSLATVSTVALIVGGMWIFAERTATARAAEDDLDEMVQHLRASSWPEATAARDRAVMRLGTNGQTELRRLADQGTRELELATRLDPIQLKGAESVIGGILFTTYDQEIAAAFRAGGLGEIGEDPDVVASRIGETNIVRTLINALDYYSIFVFGQERSKSDWAVKVARKADPNESKWLQLARDPELLEDSAARAKLIKDAPIDNVNLSSLLVFERYLADPGISIDDRLAILKKHNEAHSDNLWFNLRLGNLLSRHQKSEEALGYNQAAVALRPGSAYSRYAFGGSLRDLRRHKESVEQFRRATEIDPTIDFYHQNFAMGLFKLGQQDTAVSHLRSAIQRDPKSPLLNSALGFCLEQQGHLSEALDWSHTAVRLDPANLDFRKSERDVLLRMGRMEDARLAWQATFALKPPDHDALYGYAELCLFLGNEEEYLRQREQLLKRFGSTTDPQTAERVSRTCHLLPATEEELATTKALADCALAVDRSKNEGAYPYYLFAGGLAEFRQGKFERAIATMRGDASRALGPAPKLVLAMALQKTGKEKEARQTLAAAIVSHEWRASEATNQDAWIYHVLRREAQRLILPNLPAFLEGKYQPQDNDERLALVGECQFTNRSAALARLFADAFTADPKLAEDTPPRHRWKAARAAALAGSGHGEDAAHLEESEKKKWRSQGKQWLLADLDIYKQILAVNPTGNGNVLRFVLKECQTDPDLAGLFEPAELEKLSADERKEWLAIWDEVRSLAKRVEKNKD
jgi:serine/threonine protein kinase/tetratricopeptide (TPR) repeat protein